MVSMHLAHAVDEAFQRLALLYGREFTSKFDPDDIPKVKAAWQHELQAVPDVLDRIAWALRHLPERCPNALQFRNLCQQAPLHQAAMQPSTDPVRGPTPDELQALHQLRDSIEFRKPSKQWAFDIIAKHERGEHVNTYPLRCAREVVGMTHKATPAVDDDDPLLQW